MIALIVSFFHETHMLKKGADSFADICQMWLDGCSFVEMKERTSLSIADLEDICNKSISYELSFLVGSIIDIIEINEEDAINPLPNLLLIQRKMKYGVRSETAVSICEKFFNDRILANLIADKIGNSALGTDMIIDAMKIHKDVIFGVPIRLSGILF